MKKGKFVDGIMEVGFVGGAVRVNLGVYAPGGDPQAKPVLQEAGSLIMTPEGFVAVFNGLQEVMNRFEKAGMIKKAAPGGKPEDKPSGPVSPNFS